MSEEHTVAHFKVGDFCVCKSSAVFRSGERFQIVGISHINVEDEVLLETRYCYIIQFPDGMLDSIPIQNEQEFGMQKVVFTGGIS